MKHFEYSAQLEISGTSYLIHRHPIDLPGTDLIAWLETQPLYPKVFWQEKDPLVTRAAVGSVLRWDHVPQVSSSNPFDTRFYGGIRFNASRQSDPSWEGFDSTSFWLPQIEITQEGGRTTGVVYSLHSQDLPPEGGGAIKENLDTQAKAVAPQGSIARSDLPDFKGWRSSIEAALRAISSCAIDKIVLARRTTLHLSETMSPWPMLRQLELPCGAKFAFQLGKDLCFLGATPERLFCRVSNQLTTDALAATCPRGSSAAHDAQLAQELVESGKNQREFQVVKDFLEAALSPLSETVAWEGGDQVLKGSHVQHIHNCLSATLKRAISDADLIGALHPTPALGGYPRGNALKLLAEIEPLDRGWYGGVVGMISQEQTRLYVAIRSALLNAKQLHLFAGTGIVAGSTPEKEWEELEQKIAPFMEQFIHLNV